MLNECFVIMPFSATEKHTQEYWTKFFEDFISPAVERLGYSCRRSEARPNNIIKDLLSQLQQQRLVIAVLTDFNPNVWYELGVRHTLRNGTIMILEHGATIPFDINQYGVIYYTDTLSGMVPFQISLEKFVKDVESNVKIDSPVKDFFNQQLIKTITASPSGSSSPLQFPSALENTKQRLLVVGQNLHSLTQNRYKDLIFEALRTRNIYLELLLCDPKDRITVEGTKNFVGGTFSDDLDDSIHHFSIWQIYADQEKSKRRLKGSLEIRLSNHIGNVSLTFVDPDLECGKMEIIPVIFDSRAAKRPHFILNRNEHDQIFDHYWSAYDLIFRTGGSRSIRELLT